MSGQLELELFEPVVEHLFPTGPIIFDTFAAGEYAVITEIGSFGYYYGERCYVHEVLDDGYRVEICEGLVWGRPWCKDGTMLEVPKTALSRYDHESHMGFGAHFVPGVEFFLRYPSYEYDTNSTLV
jgi:hypothetical protein